MKHATHIITSFIPIALVSPLTAGSFEMKPVTKPILMTEFLWMRAFSLLTVVRKNNSGGEKFEKKN
jgi:hypothetical protein